MGEGEANTQNVSLSLSLSFVRDRVIAVAFNRAAANLGLLFFHRRITDSWRKLVGSCLGKLMLDRDGR